VSSRRRRRLRRHQCERPDYFASLIAGGQVSGDGDMMHYRPLIQHLMSNNPVELQCSLYVFHIAAAAVAVDGSHDGGS
jgi:hypothetical protein